MIHSISDRRPWPFELPSVSPLFDLPVIPINLPVFVGGIDERSNRRSAQMGAMANVRESVFVIWIKAEVHRHPSLNVDSLETLSQTRDIKCFLRKI